jgi:hypothetical protein
MRCGGNLEVADAMAREELRHAGIDPALIALLINIALLLWKYWMEKDIKEPSVVESADEPIDWEDGEDD